MPRASPQFSSQTHTRQLRDPAGTRFGKNRRSSKPSLKATYTIEDSPLVAAQKGIVHTAHPGKEG